MKVVYVAGRLSAANNYDISRNVRAAEDVAMEVVRAGAAPFIPQANTGMTFWGTATEEFWYAGTLEMMRRCDAIIMVPGWEASKGAKLELAEATKIGMPCFMDVQSLMSWLGPIRIDGTEVSVLVPRTPESVRQHEAQVYRQACETWAPYDPKESQR